MSRILGLIKKYGFFRGLSSVFAYYFRKARMKGEAAALRRIPLSFFEIAPDENAPSFYQEGEEDVLRIQRGERKLLFYAPEDENGKKDTKYLWECHRCHEIFALALSEGEEGKALLKEALEDSERLCLFQGECSMEVAIRAICVAESCRRAQGEWDKSVSSAFLRDALVQILTHPEAGVAYQSNHHFFGLLGLIWVMELLPENPLFFRLLKRNHRRLAALLKQTVDSDGSFFECSTHYHLFVTRSLLEYLFFTSSESAFLKKKAAEMMAFARRHAVNGAIVGIGDNDSGRVLPLPNYFAYNSADLSAAEQLLNKIQCPEARVGEERFGLYLLSRDGVTAAFRCDPIPDPHRNAAIGGHAHNDQLSLQLWVEGEMFFVDRGTYLYIADEGIRPANMKTRCHNTLSLSQREQNPLPKWFDYRARVAKGKILSHGEGEITGEHTGFAPLRHRRRLSLSEGACEIYDTLLPPEGEEVEGSLTFLLHPDVAVEEGDKGVLLKKGEITLLFRSELPILTEKAFYSPEYGENKETLMLSLPFEKNKEFKTTIKRI